MCPLTQIRGMATRHCWATRQEPDKSKMAAVILMCSSLHYSMLGI